MQFGFIIAKVLTVMHLTGQKEVVFRQKHVRPNNMTGTCPAVD